MKTSLAVLIAAGMLAAADAPYFGKWKLNPAKSDFGETTVTYEQQPGGETKVTVDGLSYTFKADGKENQTPWGGTSAWKSIDANTWEVTIRANGKVVSEDRVRLSADGKSMAVESKMFMPTGESSTTSMTFQRTTGTQGLGGKWKTRNVAVSYPGTLELAAKGNDGIVMTYVNENGVCDAKFDGRDYSSAGPMWPSGWTCKMTRSGPSAFEASWKKDGKPMYKSVYSVSADGKSLTDTSGGAATAEKVKIVYDRQ